MTNAPDPRRHAWRADLADAALAGRVEAARFVAGKAFVLAVPAAPLRRHPARDAPLDSEVLAGETLDVFETRADGWSWVQLGRDRHVGYVETAFLAPPGAAPTHRLRVPRSLVYPEANMKAPPVSWLPLGARVAVAAEEGRFLRLARGGFVVARHAAPLDGPGETDFVAVAEAFLSIPYLWGGKTGLGLDCSGLVQVSLLASGFEAPRDSDMQAAGLGVALVTEAPLQRGDLVFWKGHVGIMRDADTLLHANGTHMLVSSEPLALVRKRNLAVGAGDVACIRRLPSHCI